VCGASGLSLGCDVLFSLCFFSLSEQFCVLQEMENVFSLLTHRERMKGARGQLT